MIASSYGLRPSYRHVLLFAALAIVAPLHMQADDATAKGDSPLVESSPLSDAAFARVNNSALGLAGRSAGESWESSSDWRNYQQWITGRWGYLERVRLNAMRNWSNAELSGLRGQTRVVFYPFSGPDVLYADTLFPNSKYLVMAGLEPVGSMPDFATLESEGRLGSYLQQVKTSLYTILAASFFKTKDMKSDFNNNLVDGLMPAMIVFLSREGYTIDSIQYVMLGSDGTLHKGGKSGVQITYFKGDRGDLRTVFYFQTDLGNDGLKSNPGYVRLMERLGPGITYLKAASYLLYEDYFSSIRNGILNNSIGVVEDDSGIPFRYFKSNEWNVVPYGNYTGPIPLFKEHYQQDLSEYYSHTSHSPLSFGSGYKFVASISSLLVAKKK
jgi:hypothetical protein